MSLLLSQNWAAAQLRLVDNQGEVHFYSEAPLEDIKASNTEVKGVIDFESKRVAVVIKMNAFQFEKSLMQEHFNENYLESEKYPKATFTGSFTDAIDLSVPGKVQREIAGTMTIHGVTNPVTSLVVFDITKDSIKVNTVMIVRLEDYQIKIPKIVFAKIAEEVEVTVSFNFKKP